MGCFNLEFTQIKKLVMIGITFRFRENYPMVLWEGYSKETMDSVKIKLIDRIVKIDSTPKVGMYLNLQSFIDFPLYNFTDIEVTLFKEVCKKNFVIKTITLYKTHLELLII